TMTGCRQQKPKLGLTKCPDLVDHYSLRMFFYNCQNFVQNFHLTQAALERLTFSVFRMYGPGRGKAIW
ncbi:hypothetical protein, partial [Aeromonas veronii]|uniref:hypothetical protein n=1 Tax=Aeromonas veronii TaxID=654 RepID=UPI003D1F9967